MCLEMWSVFICGRKLVWGSFSNCLTSSLMPVTNAVIQFPQSQCNPLSQPKAHQFHFAVWLLLSTSPWSISEWRHAPLYPRLFGTKASSKASSPGTPDSGKCPSVLGSPHGTLARQASLDSPSSGTGSLGSTGGLSGGSSPLYGKTPDLCTDSPASSPASGLSLPSNARPWPACSSSAGSKDTLSCQSMTSLHTSSESIDLPLGHHGPKVTRTGSVKSTLSEGWVTEYDWAESYSLFHFRTETTNLRYDHGSEA